MTFAMVGLAVGLGARYPRFGADPNQVAGSYGGVAFMILAVLYIIVMIVLIGWPSAMWLFSRVRSYPLSAFREAMMAASFLPARALSVGTWLIADASGVARAGRYEPVSQLEVESWKWKVITFHFWSPGASSERKSGWNRCRSVSLSPTFRSP